MTLWVRIRSWHALGKPDRTLCGRAVTNDAETDTESCLRILARKTA